MAQIGTCNNSERTKIGLAGSLIVALAIGVLVFVLTTNNNHSLTEDDYTKKTVTVMDFLAPYLEPGLGVYLKADNGFYLSVMKKGPQIIGASEKGYHLIEAAKAVKDPWCKFNIEIIDENYIYIYSPTDKKYLSRINVDVYRKNHWSLINYIESAKTTPYQFCKFKVLEEGGKIILQADNGKFLSRIARDGNQNNIEAAKGEVDMFCKFSLEEDKKSINRFSGSSKNFNQNKQLNFHSSYTSLVLVCI